MSDEERELIDAERAALAKGPPANATNLSKPAPGIRVDGWFINIEDSQAYRREQYAKQKAEADATMRKP